MKKIFFIFLTFAVCMTLSVYSAAYSADGGFDSDLSRLADNADLLTDEQEAELSARLDDVSRRYGMDFAVVIVYSLDGRDPGSFAEDYFYHNGYGQGDDRSGILLLHSPENRDWWISTHGRAAEVFTDSRLDYIGGQLVGMLADGDNAGAYNTFINLCCYFLDGENSENSGSGQNSFSSEFVGKAPGPVYVLISAGIGLVIAGIIVSSMAAPHKSVRFRSGANDYVRSGSMNLTREKDIFLYSTVTRTPKPRPQSSRSHHSSGRSSHGGRGGKY